MQNGQTIAFLKQKLFSFEVFQAGIKDDFRKKRPYFRH